MTREPPLRAQPDSRILANPSGQFQGNLFDEQRSGQNQLLADYRQRYGLSEDPFSSDYSFPLFTGAGRRQVLDRLLHLCQFSNSLLVVLGEYGVGKTRVAHALMDSLSDNDKVSYLPLKAGQSPAVILSAIADDLELQVPPGAAEPELLSALEADALTDPLQDEGLVVVVFDDAHLMDPELMRGLLQLMQRLPEQHRLHLVLFGESILLDQLEACEPGNILLNDFFLQPLSLTESVDYLNFRMEMADYLGPEIFTEAMVNPWWRQAQGQLSVLHDCARDRLLESVAPEPVAPGRGLPVLHIVAISTLIALVGVLFLYMGDDEDADKTVTSLPVSSVPVPASAQTSSQPAVSMSSVAVQPILASLPGNAAPAIADTPTSGNTEVVQPPAPAVALPESSTTSLTPLPSEEDKVVPLAELPVTNRPAVTSAPPPAEARSAAASSVAKAAAATPASVKVNDTKPAVTAARSSQEQHILSWPASNYTIQLLGVSNEKAARDYVAGQSNKKELLVFKSKRQGRDWFVVITGHYATAAQARQAIAQLPAVQRNAGPWPREVKVIQQEIKAAY